VPDPVAVAAPVVVEPVLDPEVPVVEPEVPVEEPDVPTDTPDVPAEDLLLRNRTVSRLRRS